MSPASYQTAPPRNVWTHRVRKELYYAQSPFIARASLSVFTILTPFNPVGIDTPFPTVPSGHMLNQTEMPQRVDHAIVLHMVGHVVRALL